MLTLARAIQKIHISWYVASIALGILTGTALAGVLHVHDFSVAWIVITSAFLFVALIRRQIIFLIFAIIFGLSLGLWRGALEQSALRGYTPFYNKTVHLRGVVSEDTSYGPHGDQRIMLKNIAIDGQKLHGQVWVSLVQKADIRRSDTVTISGKLGTGFGNLPASMFYANLVTISRPEPGDIALKIRDWFSGGIQKAIPQPEASLGVGYVVGQRSALPINLDNEFKTVGLTHAVVASGYNLTILVVFARRAFLKKSKYLAMLSAAAMAGGFMLIAGFSPSMTRAGIVTVLSLAAWYYGRRVHPLILLPVAAALTTLLNPAYVWGDIGWALSFAAFGGVLLLAPLLHHFFWDDKKPGVLREVLVGTISAQLVTMPIMIFAFGHYSPYAIAANLLVLPLIPLTMLLTFVAGIGGLALPGLAQWFGLPATIILRYMTNIVGWIANLPSAQSNLTFNATELMLSYVMIIALVLFLWYKTSHNFRQDIATEPTEES